MASTFYFPSDKGEPESKYKKLFNMQLKKSFLAFLSVALLLSGCKVSKDLKTDDKSKTTTETERKETTRAGDTVTVVRPFNVRYKDTTIYTYSYETKSMIREIYDKDGNQRVDCITDEIRELIETQKQMIENDIKSREQRESEFNPASLIWAIAGLAVVVLFMGIVGFVLITRIQKSIPGIVAESVKSIVSETNRN
ncbi:MAG TPA: hypothetical protein PK243_11205 [Flexilinea sp.]|nr:hypothetical protein [Flexilinea sp.]